jgi:hypothetical protein
MRRARHWASLQGVHAMWESCATSGEMGTKTITCPDCGLVLKVEHLRLVYDVDEWRRRCIRVHLDNPAWCLIQRNGTSGTNR